MTLANEIAIASILNLVLLDSLHCCLRKALLLLAVIWVLRFVVVPDVVVGVLLLSSVLTKV